MDRFEVFTIGGGRYLFNFFHAMAAIAQSDAYEAVIASAVMIGTIWITSKLITSRQWDAVPRYMLLIVIMLYGGLYPKATVKITDTIDPVNSGGYIVANVPWGVAAITGLFTMASHGITTLLEDNLVDVGSPKYAEHGMVFGASLLANATRLEIRDTSFSASMGSFIRECLGYDILHGRKSMDDRSTRALASCSSAAALPSSAGHLTLSFMIALVIIWRRRISPEAREAPIRYR